MKIAAVKAPRYGEERRSILEDLSTHLLALRLSAKIADPLKRCQAKTFGMRQESRDK